jgi:hypothetical protein
MSTIKVTNLKHESSSSDNISLDSSANTTIGGNLIAQAGSASTPAIQATGDANTGIYFSGADAVDVATGGTQALQLDSSQNLKFNSGYGSVATAYGVRAWVNFNGRNTLSIYDDGGVSSITDNGVGDYTVNFDFTMPDINYAFTGSASYADASSNGIHTVEMRTGTARSTSKTTSSIRLDVVYANATDNRTRFDYDEVNVVFFR